MHEAIQGFLGLEDLYPVVRIGTAAMLAALEVLFPAEAWGISVAGYFTENPEEAGATVGGIEIHDMAQLPALAPSLGAEVALVACSPASVQRAIDLCGEAGLHGVLLVTPSMQVSTPAGMRVSQVRIPCDIKSLACRCG